MNFRLLLVLLIVPGFVTAQDTIFFDYKWNKTATSFGARYFQVSAKDSVDATKIVIRKYKRPGTLLEETVYSDTVQKIQNGTYRSFYETGQLHAIIPYKKGKIDGELITYWGDGQLKRTDKYSDGNFISGKILNTNGRELPYYPYVILPSFKKGEKKLQEYLAKNLMYPAGARERKENGTVKVGFTVSDKGVVNNPVIISGVSSELDQEALRVVKEMPRWNPGMVDGIGTAMFFILPVRFDLQ